MSANDCGNGAASPTDLSVGLVGKTGTGKSTLGNALLKTEAFETSSGFDSETVKCKSDKRQVGGFLLTVVDTPGTMDTKDKAAAFKQLTKAIHKCPDGFDSFLVVLQIGRFTDEEYEGVMSLKTIFGDQMIKYTIVVFTHADKVRNDDKKFQEQMKRARANMPKLDELVSDCGNRVFMVDNSEKRDPAVHDAQIRRLLDAVLELRNKNGGKYTNDLFEKVKRDIEAKRKAKEENKRKAMEAEENMQKEMDKMKTEMEKALVEQNHKMQMMQMQMDFEKQMREQSERHHRDMREEMERRLESQNKSQRDMHKMRSGMEANRSGSGCSMM